jgi:ornithine cyclodeaminase/alanine dehydrogenase-like protein (mu-crystallin family)
MIVLTQRDVVELLSMTDCIDVMGRALGALTRGESILPLRTVMRLPNGKDFFAVMPAFVASPDSIGVKIITVFPGNHGTPLDSHQGAVLLLDAATGSVQALLDASSITAIRTAAVSALATQHLARANADDLAILGSGVQARSHLEAIALVRPLKRIRIWSRDTARARALRHPEQHPSRHPERSEGGRTGATPRIEVCGTAEEAVHGASIICTTTASAEPVLHGEWIADGAHVNAVGASSPKARELDTQAIARASVFVDRRESALNESGDILIPIAEGAIKPTHILAELGEVVIGRHPGRTSDKEVTVFKSLGLAVEDVAAAQFVYARAVERSIGTVVDLGGARHGHT